MRCLALTVMVLAFPAMASAQAAPSRERVREMLSGIEDTPSDADWQRLGDGVLPVLIELYQDTDQPPYVRLRAVTATGAFPRPAVRTFLLAVANVEGQNDLTIRQAVATLARAFGDAALDDLMPFLSHEQASVREGAVLAVGGIERPAVSRALRARLRVERDANVRAAIEAALR